MPAPQKSAQALAAQRAFFQQALAQAGQPAAPASTPAAQAAPTSTAAASAPAASSEPSPRLGRYLDIRV
jgi:hypothetical protein